MARQMKDSGIEWIGQIPEEWHVSKIKNVYIVILGKMLSPSQTQKDQTLENYLCAANIKWSGVDTSIQKQMWFSESDKAEYKLHEGDILIMEGGLAGTSCKYRGEMAPCFIQNSVHCCRAKSNYSNQFLYYWMNVVYNSKYIENICNKATIQHYTKEKVMNTPFLICSSLEQEKIVSYLDRKCAQIDAIISKQQQIIEKLKEYKLSVITEAVTKGLDPNVPMKDSGVEWIGKIPEHWTMLKLKHTSSILRGKFNHRPRNDPAYYDGNHPFVQTGDVARANKYIKSYSQTLNEKGYAVSKEFPANSICMTIAANVGDVAILTFDACFPDSVVGFVPSDNIAWDYLYYVLTAMKKQFVRNAIISTQLNLNIEIIKEEFIPVAPLRIQKEISKFLDGKYLAIDRTISAKQSAIDKLTDYKKSLIYEVVTGKKEV